MRVTRAVLLPGAGMDTRAAFDALIRQGASPGTVEALERMNAQIDVREALSAIRVPTLVMVRADDDPFNVRDSRYLAEHIPGAQYVEFEGSAHPIWAGNQRPVLEQLEAFLDDAWARRAWEEEPDRLIATVLFTDLVDSTAAAVEVGDRRWRNCSADTTRRSEPSSRGSVAPSLTPRVTAFPRVLTGRRARSVRVGDSGGVAIARPRSSHRAAHWGVRGARRKGCGHCGLNRRPDRGAGKSWRGARFADCPRSRRRIGN
jgi:hypothetical protein